MSTWKIQKDKVATVLRDVGGDVDRLGAAVTEDSLQVVMGGVAWGGELTQPVSTAVGDILIEQQKNLQGIVSRGTAAIVGVSNAVIAYDNGQEEMAATFQTELFSSAESGDLSYFALNGYQGWGRRDELDAAAVHRRRRPRQPRSLRHSCC